MKNIVFILWIAFTILLSWCSIDRWNDFDRNVKCYGLAKEFIKELNYNNDLTMNSLDYVFYSKKSDSCIMAYTEDGNYPIQSKKKVIKDILREQWISSSYWTWFDEGFIVTNTRVVNEMKKWWELYKDYIR